MAKISEAHDAWVVNNVKDEFHDVLKHSNFDIKALQVDVAKSLVEDVDAQLQKRFLNCCLRRLSQSAWKHMTTSNANVLTYESLKVYIKKIMPGN
jgi:hypothetical protein